MLLVKDAEKIILDLVKPIDETEIIDLIDGGDRHLATDIQSKLDFPYWDNSAMDGYAVNHLDVKDSSKNNPTELEIIEEIPAGYIPKLEIKSGQTSRIFTGAMLPKGADTIVIQENTQKEGNKVKIFTPSKVNEFIRKKGAFYQANENLLTAGIKINPPEMAILATAQCTKLKVFAKPKIAIFSTGNELIKPEETLRNGQIIDSNKYLLHSFILQNNAIPIDMGIVKDDKDTLKNTIYQAINQANCVISTGGVSVGDYDYIDEIILELGGKIEVKNVAIKPGKPLTFATFKNGCIYFGIPGNPVSTMVICWRFVKSALLKLSGAKNDYYPIFINAKTRHNLTSDGKRETYIWGKLHLLDGVYEFQSSTGLHNSANLINLAQTNALAVIPIGTNFIESNQIIKVLQIS